MTIRKPQGRIRQIPAGEFKARCLALLDEVGATGETLVITKRGRPVAKLMPVDDAAPRSLLGSVLREKDIIRPTGEAWDADP